MSREEAIEQARTAITAARIRARRNVPERTTRMTPYVTWIDAVHASASHIPADAAGVAGYVTGTPDIRWTPADWARFPRSGKARINQDTADPHLGDIYDAEFRALTIPQVVSIARERAAIGWNTDIYIAAGNVIALTSALAAAGVAPAGTEPGVRLWVADWNLSEQEAAALLATLIGGYPVTAVQWASPTSNPATILPGTLLTLQEANADLSVALPSWFRYIPPPPPPPPWQLAALAEAEDLFAVASRLVTLLKAHQ